MERFVMSVIFVVAVLLGVGFVSQASEAEVEELKADLMGKSMGGREKGWTFQSPSQITALVINRKTEGAQHRQYSIILTLQDSRVPGMYRAEAEVTYRKADSRWEIQVVGLKSLVKID